MKIIIKKLEELDKKEKGIYRLIKHTLKNNLGIQIVYDYSKKAYVIKALHKFHLSNFYEDEEIIDKITFETSIFDDEEAKIRDIYFFICDTIRQHDYMRNFKVEV